MYFKHKMHVFLTCFQSSQTRFRHHILWCINLNFKWQVKFHFISSNEGLCIILCSQMKPRHGSKDKIFLISSVYFVMNSMCGFLLNEICKSRNLNLHAQKMANKTEHYWFLNRLHFDFIKYQLDITQFVSQELKNVQPNVIMFSFFHM